MPVLASLEMAYGGSDKNGECDWDGRVETEVVLWPLERVMMEEVQDAITPIRHRKLGEVAFLGIALGCHC